MSLAAALEASGRGDLDAFAVVFDRAAPLVLSYVRHAATDGRSADDVTWYAMVETWRLAPHFEAGREPAVEWVLAVARDVVHRSVEPDRATDGSAVS